MKLFPVIYPTGWIGPPLEVPYALLQPHGALIRKMYHASLERLAERGGLAPCEIIAVLERRAWEPMGDSAVWRLSEILKNKQPIKFNLPNAYPDRLPTNTELQESDRRAGEQNPVN